MRSKVLNVIREYSLIEDKDNIIIGVSGGPDSMALLYVLLDIMQEIDFNLHIAHVNHGVRGEDALRDEKFVKSLAERLNLPYYSKKVNMDKYAKEEGLSSEEAGRKLRYSFFREIASDLGGGKIAVAHNKDDQAETLLMRFLRGTGIDGLRGMQYKNGDIIRPILSIERKEIEEYLEERKIDSRLDKTNLETIYNRNKIRLELMPYIRENFNPNIIDTLWRTSRISTIDSEFLEKYARKAYKEMMKRKGKDSIILDRKLFLEEDRSIQQRIIRNSILDIRGNLQGFTEKHITDILVLFLERGTGKSTDLIDGVIAKTSYEDLIIEKGKGTKNKDFSYKLDLCGTTYISEFNYKFKAKVFPTESLDINKRNRFIKYFDYDKIIGDLQIRNRKDGDRFVPYGMTGSKKIKDYFIDEKVPREDRDIIPLITDRENILWVVGYRSSELYKITTDTKNILTIEFIK